MTFPSGHLFLQYEKPPNWHKQLLVNNINSLQGREISEDREVTQE